MRQDWKGPRDGDGLVVAQEPIAQLFGEWSAPRNVGPSPRSREKLGAPGQRTS